MRSLPAIYWPFFANTVLLDSNIIWVNGTMNKMLRSRIYYEYFRSNLVVMGMFLFRPVNHKTGDKEGFAQCHFALFYDSGMLLFREKRFCLYRLIEQKAFFLIIKYIGMRSFFLLVNKIQTYIETNFEFFLPDVKQLILIASSHAYKSFDSRLITTNFSRILPQPKPFGFFYKRNFLTSLCFLFGRSDVKIFQTNTIHKCTTDNY